MNYWTVEPPAVWKMGSYGSQHTPINASCADCGEKDARIAAIISTDGTFSGIGVIKTLDSAFVKPAMFCGLCYAKRIACARLARTADTTTTL